MENNLTFQEGLIREHKAEPLQGHRVVVLKRVGEAGERPHAVLDPNSDRVRGNPLTSLFGSPDVFIAFAVAEASSRQLNWEEHVRMAEHEYDFHLGFSLWYRAADPETLVAMRRDDPLGTLKRKVAERVVEEMAEQPWNDVWYAFRVTADQVLRDTRSELAATARECGIHISALKLTPRYPREDQIRGLHSAARVRVAAIDARRGVDRHIRDVNRTDVHEVSADDALVADRNLNRAVAAAYTIKTTELIATAQDAAAVRRVHAQMLGVPGRVPDAGPGTANDSVRLQAGDRGSVMALPAGAYGLSGVLGDVVAQSEPLGHGKRRRVRALLLELVAAMLADDSPATSEVQIDRGRAVRGEVEAAQMDEEQRGALLALADPESLRSRLYP